MPRRQGNAVLYSELLLAPDRLKPVDELGDLPGTNVILHFYVSARCRCESTASLPTSAQMPHGQTHLSVRESHCKSFAIVGERAVIRVGGEFKQFLAGLRRPNRDGIAQSLAGLASCSHARHELAVFGKD